MWANQWVVVALVAAFAAFPVVQAGPFMDLDPTQSAVDTAGREVSASVSALDRLTDVVVTELGGSVESVASLTFPESHLTAIFNAAGDEGSAVIGNAGDAGRAFIFAGPAQAQVAVSYGDLMSTMAINKVGVVLDPPVGVGGGASCAADVVSAVAGAVVGQEIRLCAGQYHLEGPLVIDTPFVTLRGVSGAGATTIDGGIDVRASGVTISGLTIQNAETGVYIGGVGQDAYDAVWGTVVRDSILRGNGRAIVVDHAESTVVTGNSFRLNGDGVVVVARDPFAPDETESESLGTLVVANNFAKNGGFAVSAESALPLTTPPVAMLNHYGDLAPSVQPAPEQACFGPAAPTGDPWCRNALGFGVVAVGFSPVAY